MLKPEQLAEMLSAPSESTRLDFKGRLDWQDPAHRFEVCRDIAGLANRDGGFLIIGVAENAAGGFRLDGMTADDLLPDPTDINQVLRERFQPSISCEAAYIDSAGVRYGVIQVPEFDRWPHVCVRDAGATGQPPTIRVGDVYFRNDMISTGRASALDIQRIIERAVAKTGAAIAQLVGPPVNRPLVPTTRAEVELPAFERYPTRRALRFEPLDGDPPRQRLRRLEDLILESRVTLRGYAFMPRFFDPGRVDEAVVVREADRLIIEMERPTGFGPETVMSVVAAQPDLSIRLWESLWEDTANALGQEALDITSLFRFAYAGLLFGRRLYARAGVDRFRLGIGVTNPLGRILAVDHARFMPFFRNYRATSRQDLWVDRDVVTADLGEADRRASTAQDVVEELLDYWGCRLGAEVLAAHIREARAGLDEDQ
jgi:hypothetical protein